MNYIKLTSDYKLQPKNVLRKKQNKTEDMMDLAPINKFYP